MAYGRGSLIRDGTHAPCIGIMEAFFFLIDFSKNVLIGRKLLYNIIYIVYTIYNIIYIYYNIYVYIYIYTHTLSPF